MAFSQQPTTLNLKQTSNRSIEYYNQDNINEEAEVDLSLNSIEIGPSRTSQFLSQQLLSSSSKIPIQEPESQEPRTQPGEIPSPTRFKDNLVIDQMNFPMVSEKNIEKQASAIHRSRRNLSKSEDIQ